MSQNAKHKAAIPNPFLKPLSILVGEWDVVGTHRLLSDTLHGYASFEWHEGGAFLRMLWKIDAPEIPDAIGIFGSDDVVERYFMLYFDERGVSRKYEMTLRDNVWKYWREAPGFSQRFTGTLDDNGDMINGIWELSEDDATWVRDVELNYTRRK